MKNILFAAFLSLPILSHADSFYCKVVGVTDGDTIKCLTNDKELLKIRLYQIDAPEKKQAFGNKSKQALSGLIFNKRVRIENHGPDKYRRTLGTIFYDNKDINLEMIKQGMAWFYPFAKKNEQYKQAEEQARKDKIGLWADKKPVAPWEFRKK